MFPAPHGAVCAAVLPHAMTINIQALRAREPQGRALQRYDEVARLLTENPHATAEEGAQWVGKLCRHFEIPPLRTYGVREADVAELAEKAVKTSSMKGNPIALTMEELQEIAKRSI
jgi:alcohol dehydrogenase class IV